jgi:hypothetical protein
MRTWLVACVAAAAVACGSSDGTAVEVETVGTVELDNAAWLIRASDGVLYAPRDLPGPFRVVGARVQVSLLVDPRVLGDQPVPAGIVHIEEASCECDPTRGCPGVADATASVRVFDVSSSGPVQGVALTTVVAPEQPPRGLGECVVAVTYTECLIDITYWVPGIHVFDVSAPGYRSGQATIVLFPHQHVPGACSELAFEPLHDPIYVSLSPAG